MARAASISTPPATMVTEGADEQCKPERGRDAASPENAMETMSALT